MVFKAGSQQVTKASLKLLMMVTAAMEGRRVKKLYRSNKINGGLIVVVDYVNRSAQHGGEKSVKGKMTKRPNVTIFPMLVGINGKTLLQKQG